MQIDIVSLITIFILAVFVGNEIINKVPPTLHTPLMSGSNAISGIAIVGAIANIFIGSPILQLFISGGIALLMCAFILYDTQNIIKGLYDSPVEAALSLYLSFFNLFVSLLQILGIMNSNDD